MNTMTKKLFRLTIAALALALVGPGSAAAKKAPKYASAPAITDKVAQAIYEVMLKELAAISADCQGVGQKKDEDKKYKTIKTKKGKTINPYVRKALNVAVLKNKQNLKNIYAWEKANKKKMMEFKRGYANKYCNKAMHEKLKKEKAEKSKSKNSKNSKK